MFLLLCKYDMCINNLYYSNNKYCRLLCGIIELLSGNIINNVNVAKY